MLGIALAVRKEKRVGIVKKERPKPSSSSSSSLPKREDVQLWDLPSAPLSLCNDGNDDDDDEDDDEDAKSVQELVWSLGFPRFHASSPVRQVKKQVFPDGFVMPPWKYWKVLEEPDYRPGAPRSIFIFTVDADKDGADLKGVEWIDSEEALNLLVGQDLKEKRIGPLAAYFFSMYFGESLLHKFKLNVKGQEYPPGVLMVPMDNRNWEPFTKTNLVIISSVDYINSNRESTSIPVAEGDALIVDPGCHPSHMHAQLFNITSLLPRKLLIFLTHHHVDHIEGLQTVRQQNPNALLLSDERTLKRLGKAAHGYNCIPVMDGSILIVAGQEIQILAAPGHTDSHMALLHQPTRSLILGDHCVGQGSSKLDSKSGGDMKDYLETTHKFLDLAPRVIVPAHGRYNLWPSHMLCGYIQHRQIREAKILSAIQLGAKTAFEIVSKVYHDTPPKLWNEALSNVKLHVNHLHYLQKLPTDFSTDKFLHSCGVAFHVCWILEVSKSLLNGHGRYSSLFTYKAPLAIIVGLIGYKLAKKTIFIDTK